MNDLVILKGKEVFTDSWIIAKGTNNQHESIVALIIKYKSDFEDFGSIEFTDFKSGKRGRPTKIYQLNEPQATLLITYLDNTEIVRMFKKELVRQFYAMRRLIQEQQSSEWKFFRQQGKTVRLSETDTLKEFVEYAKARGSTNPNKIYTNYTRLANKTVGIKSVKDATTIQLNYLILVENIFIQIILAGMVADRDYHDIYRDCKERATQLSNAVTIGITA
ncbi:Rha family transcriptional regulator [Anaerocolumna xylanovorans]|uniref:Phage regulatory protein Rha n=1 Tax=Anaerocolumna xylanovorans DSM 12503 TaxID=1121345 RepID=A0A1M7Y456_9FIRM|nr:Rha family transcriptional regulator [Anaerocolumna xylanovorans]SHO46817.1 Phage regulatory protein Rha [Anaerocolumna xylanovorans DSM 12503]